MLNIKKPGASTARIQGAPAKTNNQPTIGTTIYNGAASLYTPIMGIGGGQSFVYAPPEDQSEAFIEYNDKIARGFYVSSTIPNVSDLQEETDAPTADYAYKASIQDVLVKQGDSVIAVSRNNGILLDTSNTDQSIRIQLSGAGKLRISSNGESEDFVIIASDTMNYLTAETQKQVLLVNTLLAIIESMIVTLNSISGAPVTGTILAGLITPIQTILNNTNFSNPPPSMVSSKIKIPRG
jgi:hypothetical protein